MRNLIVLCLISIGLMGCSSSGTGSTKYISFNNSVSGDSAHLIFERPSSMFMMLATARIYINGAEAAGLGSGETVRKDVAPGQVIVSVDQALAFGRFQLGFKIASGQTARFRVVPNARNVMMGSVLGVGGSAADVTVNENSGPFSLELVQ
jgi:hypothetical protein